MAGDITTAAFGLGGVALGGAINYFVTTRGEMRQRRAAVRTAARLVDDEMTRNESNTRMAKDWKAGNHFDDFPLQMDAWNEQRQVLAEHLSDAEWASVDTVYFEYYISDRALAQGLVTKIETPARFDAARAALKRHGQKKSAWWRRVFRIG